MIELALANGATPDGAAPDGATPDGAATKSAPPRKAPPVCEAELIALPGVSSVRVDGAELALTVSAPHVTLPRLLERLGENGGSLTRLSIRHASLEDVFVKLTGRHLRDGEASA